MTEKSNTVIKARNLVKEYSTGSYKQTVLNNIDLDIFEGDFTVIMGRSGSGKSTLLYCLSYLDMMTTGSVVLCGKEYKKSSKALSKLRNSEISFVFQNSNLLPDLTAFENVSYPAYLIDKKKNVNERTTEILQKLHLNEIADHHPNEMSGGEMQRVAIARALMKKPKVLFADEPTGALNSLLGEQALDLFTQINAEGQTIVMVTHDVKASLRANRILYLADGKITDELNLSPYNKDQKDEREKTVLEFLHKQNW